MQTTYPHPLTKCLHTLIEAMPDIAFFKDGEGKWRSANTAGLKLFGLLDQPWEGKTDLELAKIFPDLADTFTNWHRNNLRAWELGKPVSSVGQVLGQDGYHIFRFSNIPLFNPDGSRQGLVIVGNDITDHLNAEVTQVVAKEMLTSVFNGMEAIVYAADMDTHELVFFNELTRYNLNKAVELGGVCWKELKCGQKGPCSFCNNHILVDENGKSTGVHTREYQNTENHRWYHVQASAIRWIDGRQVRLQITTDITDRKELEGFRLQRQVDINHAARLSLAGEMASGLAHEISQPLSAANNYLQGCLGMIESGHDDMKEELCTAIKSAYFQTERAGKIVAQLRKLIHKGRNDRQWVDINKIAVESIQFLDLEIRRQQINVSFELSTLALIYVNQIEIEQVMINLLKNSIESMQTSPLKELSIKTRLCDLAIEVEVSDTGKGIPESEIDQIFNLFTSSKADGLGLGLNICQTIIESYGGEIQASSAPNIGSIFTFILPQGNHA